MLTIIFCMFILVFLYRYLLAQSKNPSGFIGKRMMRIWNGTYIPMVKWAVKHGINEQPKRILDVGMGNGASSKLLKNYYPAADITGIDISETAVRLANEKVEKGLCFKQESIERTTFNEQTFDLITAFQTHFHWENLDTAFIEIARILTPEGTVLLSCEESKQRYFLKELGVSAHFKEYLSTKGFTVKKQMTKNGWLLFIIEKNC
ncbi:class I SAM-dependent methyltransferase [Enterococcus sp. LJL128]|uniref:class I SAM-dependent methyltransferase n=1 Tax=Enterococcus sp. LJL51 TaxID=3416656 RepID=UPI003CF106EA